MKYISQSLGITQFEIINLKKLRNKIKKKNEKK